MSDIGTTGRYQQFDDEPVALANVPMGGASSAPNAKRFQKKRLWIPALVVLVLAAGGIATWRAIPISDSKEDRSVSTASGALFKQSRRKRWQKCIKCIYLTMMHTQPWLRRILSPGFMYANNVRGLLDTQDQRARRMHVSSQRLLLISPNECVQACRQNLASKKHPHVQANVSMTKAKLALSSLHRHKACMVQAQARNRPHLPPKALTLGLATTSPANVTVQGRRGQLQQKVRPRRRWLLRAAPRQRLQQRLHTLGRRLVRQNTASVLNSIVTGTVKQLLHLHGIWRGTCFRSPPG
jgi:hypothetical protein